MHCLFPPASYVMPPPYMPDPDTTIPADLYDVRGIVNYPPGPLVRYDYTLSSHCTTSHHATLRAPFLSETSLNYLIHTSRDMNTWKGFMEIFGACQRLNKRM